MRRRKKIQTDFIKFLLEKHFEDELEPDEEMILPEDGDDEEDEVPFRKKRFKPIDIPLRDDEEELVDYDDEEDTDTGDDDDIIIEKLLKEYTKLKRQYENNRIRYKRK